jgi:hypothetical protein
MPNPLATWARYWAVLQKREELGIPNPAANRWRDDEVALLGTLPYPEVTGRLGRPLQALTQKRIRLGIEWNSNSFDGRKGTRAWAMPSRLLDDGGRWRLVKTKPPRGSRATLAKSMGSILRCRRAIA